ncbi:MAG: hypothetical protein GON13_02740 [Nanoarchaeota archaeon]|nr:hypothetical protein [Nanoarchaeota archaeon]
MNCSNCNKKFENGWNYCAYCGEEKRGFFRNPFKGFSNKLFMKSFDKMFKQVFDSFSFNDENFSFGDSKNFVIKMSNLDGGGTPDIKVYDESAKIPVSEHVISEPVLKKSGRALKNVEEPEASVRGVGNSVFVELKIPHVKSINDVEIIKLGESIEVRAFGRGKSYFKVISVPDESKILKKELRGGKLFVEIG